LGTGVVQRVIKVHIMNLCTDWFALALDRSGTFASTDPGVAPAAEVLRSNVPAPVSAGTLKRIARLDDGVSQKRECEERNDRKGGDFHDGLLFRNVTRYAGAEEEENDVREHRHTPRSMRQLLSYLLLRNAIEKYE